MKKLMLLSSFILALSGCTVVPYPAEPIYTTTSPSAVIYSPPAPVYVAPPIYRYDPTVIYPAPNAVGPYYGPYFNFNYHGRYHFHR